MDIFKSKHTILLAIFFSPLFALLNCRCLRSKQPGMLSYHVGGNRPKSNSDPRQMLNKQERCRKKPLFYKSLSHFFTFEVCVHVYITVGYCQCNTMCPG